MKHFRRSRLHQDTKDVPDGELFWVHDEQELKSLFILTPSTKAVPVCAIGTRIRGKVFTSNYMREDVSDERVWKKELDKSMQQIISVVMCGWTPFGERTDILGEPETIFRCAWCDIETTEPKGSCICRITHRALSKK